MSNESIVDEAAEWFVTLRSENTDSATQERFLQWLQASPEHVREYLAILSLWTDLPALQHGGAQSASAYIERALASNVVELHGALSPEAVPGKQRSRIHRWRLPVAVAAACAVVSLLLTYSDILFAPTYQSEAGERRTLRLADGSTVTLNSLSRIRVHITKQQRTIDLLEGQALFQVARDPGRAFVVNSGPVRARALGTQFDVVRHLSGTVVTVLEGRVAVGEQATQTAGPARETLLAAGQQVVVGERMPLILKTADVSEVTAWTHGSLVFHETPLSAVIEQFNANNARRIVIERGVEDFPITGTFSSADPAMLVEFLRAQPGLTVTESDAAIVIRPLAAIQK